MSDKTVNELTQSDTIVIGTPMYNFGPPESLKVWSDLAAWVGETFRYTDTRPSQEQKGLHCRCYWWNKYC